MTSYHCPRCRIRFAVQPGRSDVEYTRCAEPGCGQRFWHGKSANLATVGVDPLDRPREAPAIERQRHEGKGEGRALAAEFHEAIRDAVQKSSVVHGENIAATVSHSQ